MATNPAVTFTWNGPQFVAATKESVKDGLLAAGVVLLRSMEKTVGVNGGGIPSAPGEPPRKQQGNLFKSLHVQEKRALGIVRVGTNYPVGRWMEFGVPNIKPKRGRYLAIPLNKKAQRMYAGLGGASLRTKNLTLIKSKSGNLILVEKTPGGKIKKNGAAFVLKDHVTIKARPWVWPSYNKARTDMQNTFRNVTWAGITRRTGLARPGVK